MAYSLWPEGKRVKVFSVPAISYRPYALQSVSSEILFNHFGYSLFLTRMFKVAVQQGRSGSQG